MSYEVVVTLGRKVLAGQKLTVDEALSLTVIPEEDIPILLGIANKVRQKYTGGCVDTCAIVNARSGNCPEDCKFCAQSVHSRAEIGAYPLLSEEAIVQCAKQAEDQGAHRFAIVTAGCGMDNDPDFEFILAAVRRIGRETALKRCCSLGLINKNHAAALKAAGISSYHHNLETSESFFPQICTTHSYQSRLETIKTAKAAGLKVCSGGIIGLGENWRQRIELAFALKGLDVDSIPLNILAPVAGTGLTGQEKLRPLEILQTFAIFRLILPDKTIRYAGGREHNLGELVPLGFLAGLNGVLLGNYLTTAGRGAAQDLSTIAELGLQALQAKKNRI